MKNVVILGSTGSIGTSALKVVGDLRDRLRVVGLAAGSNISRLLEQARQYQPRAVCVRDTRAAADLATALGADCQVFSGEEGLIRLATLPDAHIVLVAIVGTTGLRPALEAIRAGKDLALASKEILVMAGEIVMREARAHGVRVLAVDSEHSAIFQCLDGKPISSVRKLWLTASGGPFRDARLWPKWRFREITLQDALQHPSWVMGRKITIDSATLFNKGLEMIEARWLFDIPIDQVEVLIHPQSVVHSMVEFVDGSWLAQLSTPDMCLPIQYAPPPPQGAPTARAPPDFAKLAPWPLEPRAARGSPPPGLPGPPARTGGPLPAVLNAANEVAVAAFAEGRLSFAEIPERVRRTMDAHRVIDHPSLEQILEADAWARRVALDI